MNSLTRGLYYVWIATSVIVTADVTIITSGTVPTQGNPLSAQTSPVLEEQAFLEARRAINQEEFERAAELFEALRRPSSNFAGRYTADSYYWEAFARYRLGDLSDALILLETLAVYREARDSYRDPRLGFVNKGRLHDEVVDLRLRIQRQQAEQGDPRAAAEVLRRSEALLHPELRQARSDSARREYAAAVEAQRARSDSARLEYAAALEAQRARSDSARLEYAAALEAQQARSDSARRVYAEALEAQRARADSARREYAAALEARQTRANPVTLRDALDTLAALPTGSTNPTLQADSLLVIGPVTINQSGVVTVASNPSVTLRRSSQTREGCEDQSVQQAALTALLRLETERMTSVRSVLERPDACSVNLRRQAINWLARQGTEEAERELIDVVESHPHTATREAAAGGLWRYPTLSAVRALSSVLVNSEDSGLRGAAIESLRRSGPEEATQALLAFAKDSGETLNLRKEALAAFGRRDRVTAETLMQLYGTEGFEGLETVILQSLGRRAEAGEEAMGMERWLFDRAMEKESPVEIRTAALDAWSRSPSIDLQHLAQSYEELEEPDLKDRIFYALYRRAQADGADAAVVVDKMIELARSEADPEIQQRAVYWIGRTGSERAVEFLLELLRQRPGDPSGTKA